MIRNSGKHIKRLIKKYVLKLKLENVLKFQQIALKSTTGNSLIKNIWLKHILCLSSYKYLNRVNNWKGHKVINLINLFSNFHENKYWHRNIFFQKMGVFLLIPGALKKTCNFEKPNILNPELCRVLYFCFNLPRTT